MSHSLEAEFRDDALEASGRFDLTERLADLLSRTAAVLAIAATFALMLLVTYGVMMRYVFNSPPIYVDEASSSLLVFIVFMASARTFREGTHIRVESVIRLAPDRLRGRIRLATLSLGIFFCVILSWGAWQLMASSFTRGQTTMVAHLPLYLPQLAIAVGSSLLVCEMLVALAKQARKETDR